MGSNIGLPGLPDPESSYVPPGGVSPDGEAVGSSSASGVSAPVSSYGITEDEVVNAEKIVGGLSSNVPDPAAPQIPRAELLPLSDSAKSLAQIRDGVNVLEVVGQLDQQLKAELGQVLNQAAATLQEQEAANAEGPSQAPPATSAAFDEWASGMEEQITANLGQSSAVAYQSALERVGGNAWLAGTSQTAMGVALMELANALRDMAGAEAAMAILQRQAIREVVAAEMSNIIEEGDLKAEMYRKKAITMLVTACVSMAVSTIGQMWAQRGKVNGGRSEAVITARSGMVSSWSSGFGKMGDAASSFIDAEYADDLALVDAKKELYRMQKDAISQAREDELRRVGDDHAEQAKVLDILNSFYSSQHGVSISSRN